MDLQLQTSQRLDWAYMYCHGTLLHQVCIPKYTLPLICWLPFWQRHSERVGQYVLYSGEWIFLNIMYSDSIYWYIYTYIYMYIYYIYISLPLLMRQTKPVWIFTGYTAHGGPFTSSYPAQVLFRRTPYWVPGTQLYIVSLLSNCQT